jgi:hypothetical protein
VGDEVEHHAAQLARLAGEGKRYGVRSTTVASSATHRSHPVSRASCSTSIAPNSSAGQGPNPMVL